MYQIIRRKWGSFKYKMEIPFSIDYDLRTLTGLTNNIFALLPELKEFGYEENRDGKVGTIDLYFTKKDEIFSRGKINHYLPDLLQSGLPVAVSVTFHFVDRLPHEQEKV